MILLPGDEVIAPEGLSTSSKLCGLSCYGGRMAPHPSHDLDIATFQRDLSELTDRLGDAQDCL